MPRTRPGTAIRKSLNIKVDTVTPTLSVAVNPASPNGTNHWYTVPVSLNASASDSGSGMATIEYQLDGGTWTTGANITVSSDGSHTVLFRAIDAAGNTTLSSASSFQLDQAAPGSSFLAPASVQSATLSISGSSSDATSGLASAQISFDNGSSWNPLTLNAGAWSDSWDSSAQPNGNHAISVRATDQAGNVEKGAQLSLTLDNHPPLITL